MGNENGQLDRASVRVATRHGVGSAHAKTTNACSQYQLMEPALQTPDDKRRQELCSLETPLINTNSSIKRGRFHFQSEAEIWSDFPKCIQVNFPSSPTRRETREAPSVKRKAVPVANPQQGEFTCLAACCLYVPYHPRVSFILVTFSSTCEISIQSLFPRYVMT